MTLIAQILLPLCSSEVRAMLQRLRERPEDFEHHKKLYDIIRHEESFTWAERKCIKAEWTKSEKEQGRRRLLTKIMSELINPTNKYQ